MYNKNVIEITVIMNILDLLTIEEKKSLKTVYLKKGEIMFFEGQLCTSVCFLVRGEIEISSVSYEGKEVIYNTFVGNGIFGNNLLFSKQPYYKGNVIALASSKVEVLEKDDLLRILMTNKQFLISFLNYEANFGIELNRRIKLLSLPTAEERLMHHLYSNNKMIYFKNISSLARELGLQRETLSRLISKLESEGKIARKKHHIGVISNQ